MSPSPPERTSSRQVINGTIASNAADVGLNPVRFLFNNPVGRFLLATLFLSFVACVPGGTLGMVLINKSGSRPLEIFGGLLVALANLALILMIASMYLMFAQGRKMRVIYRNALLTPGVVVSESPLEFASMANLSNGLGPNRPAVKRFKAGRLPGYPSAVGTRFACVSYFQSGDELGAWGDFEAEPICHGTGNPEILKDRILRIGRDSFRELEAAIKQGQIPEKIGKVRTLDVILE